MKTYEKIETLFKRDVDGTKNLIEGEYRSETVRALKDIDWDWTEKVDGTNIRIGWDGHKVSFGGRTDRASIPVPLVNRLNEIFSTAEAEEMFEQTFGEKEVTLYGEGYGNKIQAVGKDYKPDGVDFVLFDVRVGDNYIARDGVESMARMFGISSVPIIGTGTLDDAVAYMKAHPKSRLGSCEMEGLVCRPSVELRDRSGERVIVKIKWRDIKDLV